MKFGNLRVDQRVLGTVNIGHLQVIDVAISHVQHNGNLTLSHTLWEFTQTVLESRDVAPSVRKDIIEQLALISDHLVARQEQKQPATHTILANLTTMTSAISVLASVWEELAPLLQRALP